MSNRKVKRAQSTEDGKRVVVVVKKMKNNNKKMTMMKDRHTRAKEEVRERRCAALQCLVKRHGSD